MGLSLLGTLSTPHTPVPMFITTSLSQTWAGELVNTQITTTGVSTVAVTSGSLPGNVTLYANGLLTGVVTSNGTYNFTLTATSISSLTSSKAFTWIVNSNLPVFTTTANSITVVGANVISNSTIGTASVSGASATNQPSYSYTGSFPSNVSFYTANGFVSGTPVPPASTGTITITATAPVTGYTATKTVTVTVTEPDFANNFTTPGTYSFTVPQFVSKINVKVLGAGGHGGNPSNTTSGAYFTSGGGGGGGCAWGNDRSVSAGDTITVVVGDASSYTFINPGSRGPDGGESYVQINGTSVIRGYGGQGGTVAASADNTATAGSGGSGGSYSVSGFSTSGGGSGGRGGNANLRPSGLNQDYYPAQSGGGGGAGGPRGNGGAGMDGGVKSNAGLNLYEVAPNGSGGGGSGGGASGHASGATVTAYGRGGGTSLTANSSTNNSQTKGVGSHKYYANGMAYTTRSTTSYRAGASAGSGTYGMGGTGSSSRTTSGLVGGGDGYVVVRWGTNKVNFPDNG